MADSEAAICNLALVKIGDTGGLLEELDSASPEGIIATAVFAQKRDALLESFKWPWATKRAYPSQLGGDEWDEDTIYDAGDYVSLAASADATSQPERAESFVYYSLAGNNQGNSPDESPTKWKQLSRAAWAFAFVLPDDLLAMRGIYHDTRNPSEAEKVPYDIEHESTELDDGSIIGPGRILLTDAGLPWETLDTDTSIEIAYTARITDVRQFSTLFVEALVYDLAEEFALGIRKDEAVAMRMRQAGEVAKAKARASALMGVRRDQPPIPSHILARY